MNSILKHWTNMHKNQKHKSFWFKFIEITDFECNQKNSTQVNPEQKTIR